MGNVIEVNFSKMNNNPSPSEIIIKIIDGAPVECVNIDLLPRAERETYISNIASSEPRDTAPRGSKS
jgi:hypothetical protein